MFVLNCNGWLEWRPWYKRSPYANERKSFDLENNDIERGGNREIYFKWNLNRFKKSFTFFGRHRWTKKRSISYYSKHFQSSPRWLQFKSWTRMILTRITLKRISSISCLKLYPHNLSLALSKNLSISLPSYIKLYQEADAQKDNVAAVLQEVIITLNYLTGPEIFNSMYAIGTKHN